MQSIIEILSNHQLLNDVNIMHKEIFVFQKRPNQNPFYKNNSSNSLRCSMKIPEEIIKSVNQDLKKVDQNIQIERQLGLGQNIPQYHDLNRVFEQEKCSLIHKPGEVLLVDVWATWCGPCQNPMKHNQEMLQKNEQKWRDKVRIVAVSVDQQKEVIQERIKSKGWNKIQHMTLLGWNNDHPLIKNFKIQGIPFVFLVDKYGIIQYVGHPSQINLEEKINELMNQQFTKPQGQIKISKQLKYKQKQILHSQLKKFQGYENLFDKNRFYEKFTKGQLFTAKVIFKYKIENQKITFDKSVIEVCVYEEDKQLLNQFKQLLTLLDSSIYQYKQRIIECVKVPSHQNQVCAQCKAKIQYPFYWCNWDKQQNSFRCRQCVQKKPTQEGKHFNYMNNCIYLTGPWNKIAVKGLGDNFQPEKITDVVDPHYFGCNGRCGLEPQKIGQARYICLACRSDPNPYGDYIDFCENCFISYAKGDEKKRQDINIDGHKDDHPLLRILYNVKGYYQF